MRRLALVLWSAAAFAPSALPARLAARGARALPRASAESDDTWESRFSLEKAWDAPYPSPHAPPPREELDGRPVNARADVLLWPHDAVDALLRDFEQNRSAAAQEPAVSSWVDNVPDQEPDFDLGLPREFRG